MDAVHHPVGWGNENWRVTSASGERLIVKCGPPESAAKWAATTPVYAWAQEVGVPAPRLVCFEASCPEFGGAVMRILDWMDGISPELVLTAAPLCRRFFAELGSALRALHSVALPAFSSRLDGSAPEFTSWEAYVGHRLSQIAHRVHATAGFTDDEFRLLSAQIRQLAQEVSPVVSPALCHRDLYLANMLASEEGALVALIDFDMAESWDPAVDLAKLRWLVFPQYHGAQEEFEATYFDGRRPSKWDDRVRLAELLELTNTVANARATNDEQFEESARARLRALA